MTEIEYSLKPKAFAVMTKSGRSELIAIAEDVWLIASVLQQLGGLPKDGISHELVTLSTNDSDDEPKTPMLATRSDAGEGNKPQHRIFNASGLVGVMKLATECNNIFSSRNGRLSTELLTLLVKVMAIVLGRYLERPPQIQNQGCFKYVLGDNLERPKIWALSVDLNPLHLRGIEIVK